MEWGVYLVRNYTEESWGVIDRSGGQICRSDLVRSLPIPTTLLFPVEGYIVEESYRGSLVRVLRAIDFVRRSISPDQRVYRPRSPLSCTMV